MAKEVEKVAATKPRFPLIRPSCIEIDSGLYFRRVQIKLPAPVGEEVAIRPIDLHERPAELWGKVMADRNKPLIRFDECRIVAADESWILPSALVLQADYERVVFHKFSAIELDVPDATWSDETVRIAFEGGMKFVVRSKQTGAILLSGFDKLEVAQSEYYRSQGKKVA